MTSPRIMGVVNVTPDSFSDGGLYFDSAQAIAHGEELFDEGAHFVDVGGESTRPYADTVSEEEELLRVVPVISQLSRFGRVSVDTRRESVARAAVAAGATLINDISATLAPVAGELGVGWVAMHMKGDPKTMQMAPFYENVVMEVREHLIRKVEEGVHHGVREIYIDPGIGFGKTARHNLQLLRDLSSLTSLGVPVLVGTSRKRFLSRLSQVEFADPPSAADRMEHTLATSAWCLKAGVDVVRVHEVKENVQLMKLAEASSMARDNCLISRSDPA